MTQRRTLSRVAALLLFCAMVALAVGSRKPQYERLKLGSKLPPRHPRTDTSGFDMVYRIIPRWKPDASLSEIARIWDRVGYRGAAMMDEQLALPGKPEQEVILLELMKAAFLVYEGDAERSVEWIGRVRDKLELDDELARKLLSTVIYLQGVTAMRRGENENCIMCRGETSCILPIGRAAYQSRGLAPGRQVFH